MKKYLLYKEGIEGLQNVEDAVRVIEKSAASHIHFLKQKAQSITEYKNEIRTALNRLSRFYWNSGDPLLQKQRAEGARALLVITGTKGIVGGLYHDLINEVLARRKNYESIWVMGQKGKEYLAEEGVQAEELLYAFAQDKVPATEAVQESSSNLFERFLSGGLQKIDILFPQFISTTEQKPAIIQFLPFSFTDGPTPEAEDGFPIFEPSKKAIFDILIKKYIDISFAHIIFEAKLSEFSARTITAESAIKETGRLIGALRRDFLKERRRTVTQKQIESFSVHQMA